MLTRASTVTLLLCTALAVAQPPDADDAPRDLQKLIGQLQEKEAALRELTRQERSVTRALGELDESIARMDDEAARLDNGVRKADARVKTAEVEAARLTRELEQSEDRLRRRLQSVLRLGPAADIQVLLGAHSLRDLIWRRYVVRKVASEDATLVTDVNCKRTLLLGEREQLLARRLEAQQTRERLELARKAAAQTRSTRAQALNDIAMQKGAAQRQVDEMQQARRRLKDLMDELPSASAASGFGALRGRLPWPAEGDVDIPFGPRLTEPDGVETMHSGISIVAPLGTPVHTVSKGRVVHAGWLRGFGQLLIVDHGDGYHTLLAHLSRLNVATGDQITDGDVVAYVGDSESLSGPRLYFELRAKGRPVDPIRWLQRR